MRTPTTLRNADLERLVTELESQRDRRADYVVPASQLEAMGTELRFEDPRQGLSSVYVRPSSVMLGTMAQRLPLPARLIRDLTTATTPGNPTEAPLAARRHASLAFENLVNWRLQEEPNRKFLVRTFKDEDGGISSYGRAFLSDQYDGTLDNFDMLMTVLAGVREAGVETVVSGCDLTETRMRVRIEAPSVRYMAAEFLKGYRNPWGDEARWRAHSGYARGEEPVIWAGFEISNSETGSGAWSICPRFTIQVCNNGMRITEDAMRKVHLGSKVTEGQVNWADDTRRAWVEFTSKQTRDAVSRFLDADYIEESIRKLEEVGKTELGSPQDVIEEVAKEQAWTNEEAKSIMSFFIKGGQNSPTGVMNAVTAHAQTVTDPERAAELEELAVPALRLAAAAA